jgi:hypothetical protein
MANEVNMVWNVATPALGLQLKQGLAKVRAKKEARESHFMFPGVQESVKEWTLTLPSELPLWKLKSRWTLEFLESDYRGQNPLNWGVPYIIGKLLEHRCLKGLAKSNCKGWKPLNWRVFYIIGKLLERICLKWVCKERLQGSKPIELRSSLYHWRFIGM